MLLQVRALNVTYDRPGLKHRGKNPREEPAQIRKAIGARDPRPRRAKREIKRAVRVEQEIGVYPRVLPAQHQSDEFLTIRILREDPSAPRPFVRWSCGPR